ncbi:MAG TPA: Holliday junction branch migration DNA helicase RuvB, partial [Methylobacterium sp.]|nr:Holliday junction branch migration DNA helicase RuvB [Methylobacterium sp.]
MNKPKTPRTTSPKSAAPPLLSPESRPEDVDQSIRPLSLAEFVGQR